LRRQRHHGVSRHARRSRAVAGGRGAVHGRRRVAARRGEAHRLARAVRARPRALPRRMGVADRRLLSPRPDRLATPAATPRFVVAAMRGRVARWLRALGCGALYPGPPRGPAGDRRLLALAHAEDRVLITRDRMLARLAAERGCLIAAGALDDQLVEALERL